MSKPAALNPKLRTVLICGSRRWTDKAMIFRALDALDRKNTIIVTGGAKGADTIAYDWAKEMQFFCSITFPAWWMAQGNQAGPIRNQRMIDWSRPDLVIAFHEDPELGKGTRNMVAKARDEGIPVMIFDRAGLKSEQVEDW